jgi:hypothetical protein
MLTVDLPKEAATEANRPPNKPVHGQTAVGAPRPGGAPVYHCYRYVRAEHGRPCEGDGTIVLALPATARAWHKNPWHQYEAATFLESEVAAGWLGDQIRAAAAPLLTADPATAARFAKEWARCRQELNSLQSACHTSVELPEGNLIGLAIVAVWDRNAVHPLLQRASEPTASETT